MEILVIDTDVGLQEYYTHLLEAEFRNITVSFRPDARQALQYIPAHPPDAVLTESRVGMDLFEFIAELKRLNIPCIVVSSDSSERMIVESMRAGAHDFISKNNIKLGHLPFVIARVLLEADRRAHVNEYERSLPVRPEFQRMDRRVRDYLYAERMEKRRRDLAEGRLSENVFIDGENYFIIYLYVQLRFPESLEQSMDERRFAATQDRIIEKFIEIVPHYGGQLWTRKENAVFFAFTGEDYLSAMLAAIEIRASMNIFNHTMDNLSEEIAVNQGIAAGQTIYKEDKSQIYCEALNLSAHLAIYGQDSNAILLTSQIWDHLSARARKYLFKSPQHFEGHTVYHFEPVS